MAATPAILRRVMPLPALPDRHNAGSGFEVNRHRKNRKTALLRGLSCDCGLLLLGFADLVHAGPAHRARALRRGLAVLHRHRLCVLHLTLRPALQAVRFQGDSSLSLRSLLSEVHYRIRG
jgi:hypothetical protein